MSYINDLVGEIFKFAQPSGIELIEKPFNKKENKYD